jgi:putative pyruvate formate lyase activating enzyme
MSFDINNCSLCPIKCGADRNIKQGYCGGGKSIRVAKASLHFWEEPCISGENGSGTVFFSGCPLKCCFCQNYQISSENFGNEISIEHLSEIFLELQDKGANNINLVNPTHYVPWVIKSLDIVKNKLSIPIVYNSGGYENIETIKMLDGYIDIYMPDLKYMSSEMSKKYSNAENYFETASQAILLMSEQVPSLEWNGNLLKKGLIIRHLVLPTGRHDSMSILNWINDNLTKNSYLLSLMSQYTPMYRSHEYKEINRRTSTFEYNSVVEKACELNIAGFMQEKQSASKDYIPYFDLSGI